MADRVRLELTLVVDPEQAEELQQAALELRAALTPRHWKALAKLAEQVLRLDWGPAEVLFRDRGADRGTTPGS